MTREAVARQFFMDFLENLGYPVDSHKEFEEEECNMMLTNLFFDGRLETRWNPKTGNLMLKPQITIHIEDT